MARGDVMRIRENEVIDSLLQRLAYHPGFVVLRFEGCRGQSEVLERYRVALADLEKLEAGVLIYRQHVEARFTEGGGYADSGPSGMADIGGLLHPTGQATYWEAKRDARARQSAPQKAFQQTVELAGARYHLFHGFEEGLIVADQDLLHARRALL